MNKRIVIMAGGTGGHVFPALAVAEYMREQGWQVSWLGTAKGLESKVAPQHGIEIDYVAVAGLRGKGVLQKISAVFKLLQALIQAFVVLKRRKPSVVLGMGGFAAAPGGFMAKLLGIPLVIHEQNRVPGTTNRLLAKVAARRLEAFPSSFDASVNAECTGNPLRKLFNQAALRVRDFNKPVLNILIVGGSQGAQVLNEIVPGAMAKLSAVRIMHQTGTAMYAQVAEAYRAQQIDADIKAFIDDMVSAYQWADLIICRSGAMTVSEVSALGVPAIFIPLPGAIDDHQRANARYLVAAGAGFVLEQNALTADSLANLVQTILPKLASISVAAKQCARLQATETVAAICMEEAGV